jgi:hypothetical protein
MSVTHSNLIITPIVIDNEFIGYSYKTNDTKTLVMKLNKAINLIPDVEPALSWYNILPNYLGNVQYSTLVPAALYCRNDIKAGTYKELSPDGRLVDITYINKPGNNNFVYRHGKSSFKAKSYPSDHIEYQIDVRLLGYIVKCLL